MEARDALSRSLSSMCMYGMRDAVDAGFLATTLSGVMSLSHYQICKHETFAADHVRNSTKNVMLSLMDKVDEVTEEAQRHADYVKRANCLTQVCTIILPCSVLDHALSS